MTRRLTIPKFKSLIIKGMSPDEVLEKEPKICFFLYNTNT